MADNATFFSLEAIPQGWFAPEAQKDGWFDADLLDVDLNPPASPIYIGADGQGVVYLGATIPAAKYFGASTLF